MVLSDGVVPGLSAGFFVSVTVVPFRAELGQLDRSESGMMILLGQNATQGQCTGLGGVLFASCPTASVIRRQVTSPS